MKIVVTRVQKDDYEGFLDVFQELGESHSLHAPWKFKKLEPGVESKTYFDENSVNPDARILVAKDDQTIVGVITATKKTSPKVPILTNRAWIEVDNLVVKDGYRKQGIGKLLMDAIEVWAKECNILDIQLTVWEFNQGALSFYKGEGYQVDAYKMRKIIE